MQLISALIWKFMRFEFAQMCCRSVATLTTQWRCASPRACMYPYARPESCTISFLTFAIYSYRITSTLKWNEAQKEKKTCCFHSQVLPQSSLHIVMHSLLAWLSMLKQILSRGLFSYQPRSPNEVTPYRILGMSRMARFQKFLERCISYQIEDGWFSEKVKLWSPFMTEAQGWHTFLRSQV